MQQRLIVVPRANGSHASYWSKIEQKPRDMPGQYGRFELQIVRANLHLVTYLNHCSRSGQLFCPGKWWRHNNGEQLASARTHACALAGQWFESSVLSGEWWQVGGNEETIRAYASPKTGRNKLPGRVSVPLWHATSVTNVHGNNS